MLESLLEQWNVRIDLHFHSNNSDWWKSNEEIMQLAKKEWISMAICTDHDFINTDFCELAKAAWIQSCEWAEISCYDPELNKYFHLTCYAKEFQWRIFKILEKSRNWRAEKLKAQVELLKKNWFNICFEDFINYFTNQWIGADNLNILHLAIYIYSKEENITLIKKEIGTDTDIQTFLNKCLRREWDRNDIWGKVSVEEYVPTVEKCAELAKENKAILTLAHPNFEFTIDQFRERIWGYVDLWVNAIEINSMASEEWVKILLETKEKYNLLLTFWSDCHFNESTDEKHWDFWSMNPYINNDLIKANIDAFFEKIAS